jgi:hypothetical protein
MMLEVSDFMPNEPPADPDQHQAEQRQQRVVEHCQHKTEAELHARVPGGYAPLKGKIGIE